MKFLERALDHQNQWWKYLVVIVVGFIGAQTVGAIPLIAIMAYKMAVSGGAIMPNPENMMDLTVLGISKNVGLLLILLPSIVWLLLTIVLIKALHKRTPVETINGTNKIRFNRIGFGFGVWIALMAVYLIGDYLINSDNFVLQFDLVKFIPLFLISILLIPFQTTCEEFLFRGYLAQGVAAWTRNRLLAILLPGLLFGLIHIFNPEVKEFGFWLTMPQYVFFGLLFGLVAVLDDGIELAIGMHAANNIFLSLLITNKSSALQTDAVFEQLHLNPIKDTLSLVVIGVIAVVYFAYKYKWNFGVLTKKIEE